MNGHVFDGVISSRSRTLVCALPSAGRRSPSLGERGCLIGIVCIAEADAFLVRLCFCRYTIPVMFFVRVVMTCVASFSCAMLIYFAVRVVVVVIIAVAMIVLVE